eukprot:scaffold70237_cov57-Phaeocystis_antarctica.AAC.6
MARVKDLDSGEEENVPLAGLAEWVAARPPRSEPKLDDLTPGGRYRSERSRRRDLPPSPPGASASTAAVVPYL